MNNNKTYEKNIRSVMFVGWYPNPKDIYKNVFFQNLIYAIADTGVECTVISPVSFMHYRVSTKDIPLYVKEKTPKGNEVHVYYPKVFSASSKQIGKYNTERISERMFEQGALGIAKKLVREGRTFDAVYGHFFLYGGLAAIKIGRKFGIPSFVAFGECDYESQVQDTYGDLTPKDINGLSGVISVSTKNAKRLMEIGIFNDIPIIVSPNSVDHNLFHPIDKSICREKLGLPKDKFIVGFVGGFIERKGDKRVLEAINSLDDVFLACAGRGDCPPTGERVIFCKPMDHNEIPNLLCAIDVFCLPTLSEGSCNAVIEAMSCGVPVISSDLPFNDDVLTSENSIRIDPMSVIEIREAIAMLKADKQLICKISKNALETAENLCIEKRAYNILNFMSNVSLKDAERRICRKE